jgi:hypothetical protein
MDSVESLLGCQQHIEETSSTVNYAQFLSQPSIRPLSLQLSSADMHTEPDNDG